MSSHARVGDTWFRYADIQYAPTLDEFERPNGDGRLSLELREFEVVKVTPCGVRLETGRFVRIGSRKQFAHAVKEDALRSFIARKERQESIYSARRARAHKARLMAISKLKDIQGESQ